MIVWTYMGAKRKSGLPWPYQNVWKELWCKENNRFKTQRFSKKVKCHACPVCSYKSFQSVRITRHIKSAHLKVRDYTCPRCDFNFSDKNIMKRHIKEAHETTKPFTCLLFETWPDEMISIWFRNKVKWTPQRYYNIIFFLSNERLYLLLSVRK